MSRRVSVAPWVAASWTLILVVAAYVANRGDIDASQLDQIQLGPSLAHPFGTDELGRDIFARTIGSSTFTLATAVLATVIGVIGGVLLGSVAVAARGRPRGFLAATIAATIAVPPLLFAILVAAIVGIGAGGAVLGVGLAQIPSLARLTQTLGASLVARDYVRAASLLGFGRRTVFARHVLPHVAGPLAIHATLVLGLSLVAISTLSFLGVGLQTPDYDWGLLVSNGQTFIATNPMAAIGPALFIVVTGVMFAGVGESIGLRRAIIVPVPRRAQRSGRRTSPASLADAGQAASVRDLVVQFDAADIVVEAVRGVSLSVPPGGRVGLVGESGSGKTLTARAIAGLLPPQARIAGGSVFASGIDMANPVGAGRVDLARACSMVFQDPNTALNPALRIGTQLTEGVRHQSGLSRRAARQLAIETLEAVQIHDATGLLRKYPHELSGGMRQRVCIAIAVMSRPALVVADEPTTALDNVVQKEVLSVLDVALTTTSAALLLIAHDLAVVAQLCDEIYVMRDGVIVEHGTRDQVLYSPRDNYTRALLEAQPRMGQRRRAPGSVG